MNDGNPAQSTAKIDRLQNFLKNNPEDPFLQYALAMEYIKMEEDDNALNIFKVLTEQHPDYIGTYYHFGKLLEKLNKKEEASDIYQLGMRIAKDQKEMHTFQELQGAYNLLCLEMEE